MLSNEFTKFKDLVWCVDAKELYDEAIETKLPTVNWYSFIFQKIHDIVENSIKECEYE